MLTSVDQTIGSARNRELLIDAQLIKPCRSAVLLDTLLCTIQRHRARQGTADEPDARWRQRRRPPLPSGAQRHRRLGAIPARVDILVAEDNEVNQLVFTQILAEPPSPSRSSAMDAWRSRPSPPCSPRWC